MSLNTLLTNHSPLYARKLGMRQDIIKLSIDDKAACEAVVFNTGRERVSLVRLLAIAMINCFAFDVFGSGSNMSIATSCRGKWKEQLDLSLMAIVSLRFAAFFCTIFDQFITFLIHLGPVIILTQRVVHTLLSGVTGEYGIVGKGQNFCLKRLLHYSRKRSIERRFVGEKNKQVNAIYLPWHAYRDGSCFTKVIVQLFVYKLSYGQQLVQVARRFVS